MSQNDWKTFHFDQISEKNVLNMINRITKFELYELVSFNRLTAKPKNTRVKASYNKQNGAWTL